MEIYKLVITGGPCGGKSTGLSTIDQALVEKGYIVFIVPETATEIKGGGISPALFKNEDFQKALLELQLKKEYIYYEMAKKIKDKPIVILYDRGALDGKAYIDNENFSAILSSLGLNEVHLRDSYDGVFHLKTAADGAEEYYTTENNEQREESVEEARELDQKTLQAWSGHSHLRIIDNNFDSFEDKIDCLMEEIYSLLGIPCSIEIEKKFLIEYPNLEELLEKYHCSKINIVQTYLNSDSNEERRIRQRGANGSYSYYYTVKKEINQLSRFEKEKKITSKEYLNLLMDIDTSLKQIRKDRYCFVYGKQYFELDVYANCTNKAILEIELKSEDQEVELPQFIKVIKEVTNDKAYKNHSLAKNNLLL